MPAMVRTSRVRAGLALLLLLPLAACATDEEIRRWDAQQCTGYGFKPGTDAFSACLQRENLARRYYSAPDPWYYYPGPGW